MKIFILFILFAVLSTLIKAEEFNIKENIDFSIHTTYSPLLSIKASKSQASIKSKEINSDIQTGYAYGISAAAFLRYPFDSEFIKFGFGLSYYESKHDSSLDIYQLTNKNLLVDFYVTHTIFQHNHFRIHQTFGLAVGVSWFKYNQVREDFYTGNLSGKYFITFRGKHLDLHLGGGLTTYGEPADALGYGGNLFIALGFHF